MPSPTQRHLISLDSGQVTPCAERSLSSARSERPFLIGASSLYTLTSTPPYAFCTGMEWLALGSLLEDDRLASPSAGRHSLNITFGSTCQPYDTVMEQMQCSLGCNLQKQISLAFAACRLLLVTVCVLGHTHTKRERPWGPTKINQSSRVARKCAVFVQSSQIYSRPLIAHQQPGAGHLSSALHRALPPDRSRRPVPQHESQSDGTPGPMSSLHRTRATTHAQNEL